MFKTFSDINQEVTIAALEVLKTNYLEKIADDQQWIAEILSLLVKNKVRLNSAVVETITALHPFMGNDLKKILYNLLKSPNSTEKLNLEPQILTILGYIGNDKEFSFLSNKYLNSSSIKEKEVLITALSKIKKFMGIKFLLQEIKDQKIPKELHSHVIRSISSIKSKKIVDLTIDSLLSCNNPNGFIFSEILGELKEFALESVKILLEDKDINEMQLVFAIKASVNLKDKNLADTLYKLVENKEISARVRNMAVISLANLADPRIIDSFIETCKNSDKSTKKIAYSYIPRFKSKKVEKIANKLIKDYLKDHDFVISILEMCNRNKIGLEEDLLKKLIDKKFPKKLKLEAIKSLGNINKDSSVMYLTSKFTKERDSDLTRELFLALGNTANEKALNFLFKQIESKNEHFETIVEAMANFYRREVLIFFIGLLITSNPPDDKIIMFIHYFSIYETKFKDEEIILGNLPSHLRNLPNEALFEMIDDQLTKEFEKQRYETFLDIIDNFARRKKTINIDLVFNILGNPSIAVFERLDIVNAHLPIYEKAIIQPSIRKLLSDNPDIRILILELLKNMSIYYRDEIINNMVNLLKEDFERLNGDQLEEILAFLKKMHITRVVIEDIKSIIISIIESKLSKPLRYAKYFKSKLDTSV